MAEVIGGAFGMTVSILQILDRVSTIKRSVRSAYDAGLFAPRGASTKALLEFFVFREASAVVEQIEASVLQAEDSEVKAFIKAYSHSFNMIGIAGAIIAQVAITAISLPRLSDTHWTAEASFIISLVCGLLSVFFSCILSTMFQGFHRPSDMRSFLAAPYASSDERILKTLCSILQRELDSGTPLSSEMLLQLRRTASVYRWDRVSFLAAVLLLTPMQLLKMSLNAFLVGLGIYLGRLYAANLIPTFGSGSLALLIIYVGTAVIGIGIFYVPQALKSSQRDMAEHFEKLKTRIEHRLAIKEFDRASEPDPDQGAVDPMAACYSTQQGDSERGPTFTRPHGFTHDETDDIEMGHNARPSRIREPRSASSHETQLETILLRLQHAQEGSLRATQELLELIRSSS